MTEVKATNPRRLVIFTFVMVIALAVLLIWARGIIRELIVLPISYVLWAARIILFVVPEIYFWMGAVAIGLLIAWRAIAGRPAQAKTQNSLGLLDRTILNMMEKKAGSISEQPSFSDRQRLGARQDVLDYKTSAPVEVSRGRVAFWNTKIHLVRRGASPYYQSTFHSTLALLLVEMLAHRYRLTNVQIEDRLRLNPESEQGQLLGLNVPDYVREYVLSRLRYRDMVEKSFWQRTRENLIDLIRNLRRSLLELLRGPEYVYHEQPLDPRVERVLKYMEEELEVPNDDNGR